MGNNGLAYFQWQVQELKTIELNQRLKALGLSIFGAQILDSINRVVNVAYAQGKADGRRDEAIRICDLLMNEAEKKSGYEMRDFKIKECPKINGIIVCGKEIGA